MGQGLTTERWVQANLWKVSQCSVRSSGFHSLLQLLWRVCSVPGLCWASWGFRGAAPALRGHRCGERGAGSCGGGVHEERGWRWWWAAVVRRGLSEELVAPLGDRQPPAEVRGARRLGEGWVKNREPPRPERKGLLGTQARTGRPGRRPRITRASVGGDGGRGLSKPDRARVGAVWGRVQPGVPPPPRPLTRCAGTGTGCR